MEHHFLGVGPQCSNSVENQFHFLPRGWFVSAVGAINEVTLKIYVGTQGPMTGFPPNGRRNSQKGLWTWCGTSLPEISCTIPSNIGNYDCTEAISNLTLLLLQDIDLQKVDSQVPSSSRPVRHSKISTSMSNSHRVNLCAWIWRQNPEPLWNGLVTREKSYQPRNATRSREAEKPPEKTRSRSTKPRSREVAKQAEKPRSREATKQAEKPRSREAAKPRSRRASREAEKPREASQAEKPRSHRRSREAREATGEAEKPRSPTNDANEMNERNKDRRPLQQSRKPASATSMTDLRNQNDRCRNQNDRFSNQNRV